jgi:hypothetical protein
MYNTFLEFKVKRLESQITNITVGWYDRIFTLIHLILEVGWYDRIFTLNHLILEVGWYDRIFTLNHLILEVGWYDRIFTLIHLILEVGWYDRIFTLIHLILEVGWYYTITVFCWGQYECLWTLKTIFTEAFRLRWILIFKIHKNSYWSIQKTVIVLLH